MNKSFLILAVLMLCFLEANAQKNGLELHIRDASGEALPGAVALLRPGRYAAIADARGTVVFGQIPPGKYTLEVSFLGFETLSLELHLPLPNPLNLKLNQKLMNLDEVQVNASSARLAKPEIVLPSEAVSRAFVQRFYDGSLASTLERLPGINSIRIGMGHSKPMIRGMAANRVLVIDDGLRHESQQWGEEHGLEIDALTAGKIEVIKGPLSVRYGSDAIGGVLRISSTETLANDRWSARLDAHTATANRMLGTNALYRWKQNHHAAYAGIGWWDAADMKLPADSADVYNFRLALPDGRLRNTAATGRSFRAGFNLGNNIWRHQTRMGVLQTKQGFFAHAHGIEPRKVDTLLHDRSIRDLQQPYHLSTHLKFTHQTQLNTPKGTLGLVLGYQKNMFEERSAYVNHGFMPPMLPESLQYLSTLERFFDKDFMSFETTFETHRADYKLTTGLMADGTRNRIDGWAFVFPEYQSGRIGGFALMEHKPGAGQTLQLGLRLDAAITRIAEYRDWFTSPSGEHTLRTLPIRKSHQSLTGSVGYSLQKGQWNLSAHLGKSFRLPTAAELGANGVNYHQFRFEKGNPALKPETSWQVDASAVLKTEHLALEISPFAAYSPDFIYLDPTPEHDYLYGNGNQKFVYIQNRVFRTGGELHLHYGLRPDLLLGLMFEGLFTNQLSGTKKGFGLPLSPPASVLLNLSYTFPTRFPVELATDLRLTAAQNRIAPPEQKTPAWYVLNLRANSNIRIGRQIVELNLQLNNLTNNTYLNHLSYYRRINLPETGRNLVLMLSMPLEKQFSNEKKSNSSTKNLLK